MDASQKGWNYYQAVKCYESGSPDMVGKSDGL